jgi:hypothetical protein
MLAAGSASGRGRRYAFAGFLENVLENWHICKVDCGMVSETGIGTGLAGRA